MTLEENRLSRAHTAMKLLLGKRTNGTTDNPRRVAIIDLAVEHAEAWAGIAVPTDGERGGSSNPRDRDEAEEIRRVHTLAVKAADRLPEICKAVDELMREAYDTVQRLTSTVDPKKLPKKEAVPGCLSCKRVEERNDIKIGGHFAPVYEKSKNSGLCRWCWDVKQATGQWPPVKAIDLYHRQGARAASKWLASNESAKAR